MTEPAAYAGQLLYTLRETLNDLIKLRVSREGSVLMEDEGEIIANLSSLQFLATDLAETRRNEARRIRSLT